MNLGYLIVTGQDDDDGIPYYPQVVHHSMISNLQSARNQHEWPIHLHQGVKLWVNFLPPHEKYSKLWDFQHHFQTWAMAVQSPEYQLLIAYASATLKRMNGEAALARSRSNSRRGGGSGGANSRGRSSRGSGSGTQGNRSFHGSSNRSGHQGSSRGQDEGKKGNSGRKTTSTSVTVHDVDEVNYDSISLLDEDAIMNDCEDEVSTEFRVLSDLKERIMDNINFIHSKHVGRGANEINSIPDWILPDSETVHTIISEWPYFQSYGHILELRIRSLLIAELTSGKKGSFRRVVAIFWKELMNHSEQRGFTFKSSHPCGDKKPGELLKGVEDILHSGNNIVMEKALDMMVLIVRVANSSYSLEYLVNRVAFHFHEYQYKALLYEKVKVRKMNERRQQEIEKTHKARLNLIKVKQI